MIFEGNTVQRRLNTYLRGTTGQQRARNIVLINIEGNMPTL